MVTVLAAIDLHRLHGLAFLDGLIVQAALAGRCKVLNSEDMQHGRVIDALTIASPFAGTA